MLINWQDNILKWPDWVKMLLLVFLTVASITITVSGLAWLLSLLPK